MRVVKAMPLLEEGRTVETIAGELGYGSASAFIAMFRRLMGVTPDEFRKGSSAATRGKGAAGATSAGTKLPGARSPRHRASAPAPGSSEEHTSELPSLMRISYAVFCSHKKNNIQ